jgi:uncharacterized protein YeaO (DUF488 family)
MRNRRPARSGRKPPVRRQRTRPALIAIKRVYEKAAADDGVRILVDRLWPRGIAKSSLIYHDWPRDLAPSNELRKWYRHDPQRFAEFRRRYRGELAAQRDLLAALRAKLKGRAATLLTATREIDLSHATVLRELLRTSGGR